MNISIPQTIAGRMQVINELLDTNVYDEDGNVVGQREPIITKDEAFMLLNLPAEKE